ncbi:hypothetical protein CSE16_00925 [Solibacillus sp. R5-41]|uniref:hypothetical protein n=1 Tax=Solibacillus sp. R5-41 TaxID=2048654 RepID=UPI000C1262C6|nr:hypothetical protein [Solibacillus sp. R5-41]ATP38706.1 hypothetical protein CSE16_00925 [Solibacillus sp. R5-41]
MADNVYITRVSVTWNDSKSNDIVATSYETPIIFNCMDISKDVQPPIIEFKNNHFFISEEEMILDFISIRANLDMLNPKYYGQVSDSLNGFIGNRILHLNVPKHFNIIDNSGRVD